MIRTYVQTTHFRLEPVVVRRFNRPSAASRSRRYNTAGSNPPGRILPAQPTPLIGRDDELAGLRRLLLHPDVHLVTLTGPPGTGKTRLALAAASLPEHLGGDIAFVPLDAVREPEQVLPTVIQTLGLREVAERSPVDTLREALAERALLLVLDNFEQVLPAAHDVAALLAACSRLRVLVTSRAPLRLRWEQEVPVLPLAVPPAEHGGKNAAFSTQHSAIQAPSHLLGFGAVALFVARAQAVKPSFRLNEENAATVAAICRRLDGLPLAIELAAARVKLFSPVELLERLESRLELLTRAARDLPVRHQTLRAAIAWSHDLLSPAEQVLLRRLGVFLGGCTLEAATAVALVPISEPRAPSEIGSEADLIILDGIASLIDQSLVVRDEDGDGAARFRMLETVHEFALEQLEASGEATDIRWRHTKYFLQLADRSFVDVRGPELRISVERLRQDLANLRAALEWSLAAGDVKTALRMTGSLVFFWWADGHVVEGRRWIERALEAGGGAPAPARARALLALGCLAFLEGDHAAATAALMAGHELLHEQGEVSDMAWAIAMLANLQPDVERRRLLAEESLARCRQAGDEWGAAFALHELGLLARDQGDRVRAAALLRGAATRFRALDDRSSMARTLLNLGAVMQRQGAHDEAAAHFAEGLAVLAELEEPEGIARAVQRIGELAAECGGAEAAVHLLAAAEAQFQRIAIQFRPRERVRFDRQLAAARTRLGDDAFAAAWAVGSAMAPRQAVSRAQRYLANTLSPASPGLELPQSVRTPPDRDQPTDHDALNHLPSLSRREVEVLRLLAAGKSNREIADALVLSVRTVDHHLTRIYARLGVSGRAGAAAVAVRHGLLTTPPSA